MGNPSINLNLKKIFSYFFKLSFILSLIISLSSTISNLIFSIMISLFIVKVYKKNNLLKRDKPDLEVINIKEPIMN